MVGHPCEVEQKLVLHAHGEKRGEAGGLAGQALCSPFLIWPHQTKGACPKKRKGRPPPPGWGPAPGVSEILTAYTLTSVFLISVFTNLTHTHTQMLFLTSENKLVRNFFLLAKSCSEMTSYID